MALTLTSRKLRKTFVFTHPAGGYVYCNGKQICEGGSFTGSTISCSAEEFEAVCRKWVRQYVFVTTL